MIRSVQYLRGIAAVLVLLHHVAFKLQHFTIDPLRWLHCADIGVDIFFIISGFIMCHSTRRKCGSISATGDFFRGRLARIIPLYWTLSALAFFIYLVAPNLVNSSGGRTAVIASFFLLPVDAKYLVQNGWTLSYEFYFYLIFMIGVAQPKTIGRLCVLSILIVLTAIGCTTLTKSNLTNFLFCPLLSEFSWGIFIYMLYDRSYRFSRWLGFTITASAIIFWIVVNYYRGSGPHIENYSARAFYYGLPAAGLCSAMILSSSRKTSLESNKVLFRLGDVSYSLYLSHPFVASAVTVVALRLSNSEYTGFVVGPLIVLLALLVASFVYKYIEIPFVRKARDLLRLERQTSPNRGV